jgi:large repetitive protein
MTAPLAAYNFDEASGAVIDYGASGAFGFSLDGTTTSRVTGHTGSGLRSTGSTPATLPDVGRTTNRTIMAWLSFAGIPSSWPIQFLVPSIDSGGWGILYLVPDIAIQGRSTTTLARASATWPSDGQPHHIAGTYDGSAIRLYIDGVLQGSPTSLAGPLRIDTNPPQLWAGTGAMASGYIDDLRIFDSVLSVADIIELMNTPVVAEEEPEPEPEPEPIPEPTPHVGGSWYQIGAIFDTAVAEREDDDATLPVACPNDGEPLREDPYGALRCPWDGWVWDGQPIRYR